MKKRKLFCCILAGFAVAFTVCTGFLYGRQRILQRGLAAKVLRFHVLANSDSAQDQELKLAVRDAVGVKLGEYLGSAKSREESEEIILAHLDEIEEVAEETIKEAGYGYGANASLSEVDFPAKAYGAYMFPAGRYEALELVLGEGEGHNWWCVMYPNMCFSGSVYETVEEAAGESLREVLSPEEYSEVLREGDYKVQFRYLTFLNDLTED